MSEGRVERGCGPVGLRSCCGHCAPGRGSGAGAPRKSGLCRRHPGRQSAGARQVRLVPPARRQGADVAESWAPPPPENWERTIKRMVTLNHVDLAPADARAILEIPRR